VTVDGTDQDINLSDLTYTNGVATLSLTGTTVSVKDIVAAQYDGEEVIATVSVIEETRDAANESNVGGDETTISEADYHFNKVDDHNPTDQTIIWLKDPSAANVDDEQTLTYEIGVAEGTLAIDKNLYAEVKVTFTPASGGQAYTYFEYVQVDSGANGYTPTFTVTPSSEWHGANVSVKIVDVVRLTNYESTIFSCHLNQPN